MSTAAHTPGPWRLDQSGNVHLDEHYHCIDGGCRWHDETGEQRKPGFLITGFMSAADARLMTAAPELLAALQQLLPHYRTAVKLYDPNTDDAFTVAARIAIAKATGGAA